MYGGATSANIVPREVDGVLGRMTGRRLVIGNDAFSNFPSAEECSDMR